MKKGFKIYLIGNKGEKILLSTFLENIKETVTFNEQLAEEENDKYSLSFEIPQFFDTVNSELDPAFRFSDYIKIGRSMILETFNPERKEILLIITSISPVGSDRNIVFQVQAEDYASSIFSKNSVDLNINTFDDEDYLR
jgi:hypothetical protein